MQQECSCGDSCPLCENCGSPQCECYCEYVLKKESSEKDEGNTDYDW